MSAETPPGLKEQAVQSLFDVCGQKSEWKTGDAELDEMIDRLRGSSMFEDAVSDFVDRKELSSVPLKYQGFLALTSEQQRTQLKEFLGNKIKGSKDMMPEPR